MTRAMAKAATLEKPVKKPAARKAPAKKAEAETAVVAYKAFNADLTCNGFQYAVGKTYVLDGKPVLCSRGFHACENPLDILNYYDLCGSRFARVTVSGEIDRQADGGKLCAASIAIDAELSLPDWIAASIKWVMDACKADKGERVQSASGHYSQLAASGRYSKLAASGDYSQLAASGRYSQLAASGDYSQLAASGDSSQLAASGDYSQLAASGRYSQLAASGDSSKLAASGDYSQLAASGRYSQLAASGHYSQLAASGRYSKLAASGDYSQLAASGDSSKLEISGSTSVAAAVGNDSRVKAATGTPVAICEYDRRGKPIGFATGIAGKDFPADTWVIANGGKLVERGA